MHKDEFRIRNSYDFSISPDGSKMAFLEYYSSSPYNPDFTSINFSFNNNKKKPEPPILVGKIHVIDFSKDTTIYTYKSEQLELPLRFLPFEFGKKSENLVFANNRKWNGLEYNMETKEWETTSTSFTKGVSIYNFEKEWVSI